VPDGAKPDVDAFHQLLREALELPIAAGPAPYFGCEATYAVAQVTGSLVEPGRTVYAGWRNFTLSNGEEAGRRKPRLKRNAKTHA
jgi:hypothetical protein